MAIKTVTWYAADGATPLSETAANLSLGQILDGAASSAVKVAIRNSGDESYGSALRAIITAQGGNDGWRFVKIGRDTQTLSPPWSPLTAEVSDPGGAGTWSGTGTKGAVVTAVNSRGETIASVEITAEVTDTSQTVTWGWPAVSGATGYKVYRTDTPGTYSTPSLIATIGSGATITFEDDGSTASAGAPPDANTTGGAAPAYGSAPTLSASPATLGALAPEQWVCLWFAGVIPSGTSPQGNRRVLTIELDDS